MRWGEPAQLHHLDLLRRQVSPSAGSFVQVSSVADETLFLSCHEWGDNWNLEDLSLWSYEDTKDALEKEENQTGGLSNRPNGSRVSLPRTQPYSSAAPSALSLNTMSALLPNKASLRADGTPTSATPSETFPATAEEPPSFRATMFSSEKGFALPNDVLTDGSRAVGAFSRPYPIATVGVPVSLDFEIKSSTFTMVVEIYGDDEVTEKPTEIFLPWVHYGSDKGFEKPGSSSSRKTGNEDSAHEGSQEINVRAPSGDSDTTAVQSTPTPPSPPSSISKQPAKVTTATITHHDSPSSSSSSANTPTARLPAFELDVDVQVSTGRYTIEGQILKWYYSPPPMPKLSAHPVSGVVPGAYETDGSATAGPKPARYTIKVKRRGGPIKSTVASGGKGGGGLWEVCSRWL